MKWVLVLISLTGYEPTAKQAGVYATMIDCFFARERYMDVTLTDRPKQAVCIRTDATLVQ